MNPSPIVLFLFGFLLSIGAYCQPETIHFGYDAAGNRTAKFVFRNLSVEETHSIVQVQPQLAPILAEEPLEPSTSEASDFILYPNPTREYVIIDNPALANSGNWNYQMYNTGGVLMLKGSSTSFPLQIDFSNIARGNYYLRLSSETISQTFSIIKM